MFRVNNDTKHLSWIIVSFDFENNLGDVRKLNFKEILSDADFLISN